MKRPGGRTARTRTAVFEAALELLSQKGPAEIAMADVALRAGVAVTSLYRRWGSIDALLMDVAVERLRGLKPLPDTGTLAGDLQLWGERVASGLSNPERASVFRVLVASAARVETRSDERHKALGPRIEQISAMLQRAKERGEKVPSTTDVVDCLLAPLYTRALFGIEIRAELVSQYVNTLLRHAV